jgi:hypothetical protein
MPAQVKTNDERPMGARVKRRLNPDYANQATSWHRALPSQAEAATVPNRCCTEIFFSGGQHNGYPGGEKPSKATSGDSYRTEGGGY